MSSHSLFFIVLFYLVAHSVQLDCVTSSRFTTYEDFKSSKDTTEGQSCVWKISWTIQPNSTTTTSHTFQLDGVKETVNGCGKISQSADGVRKLTCGCKDKDECNQEFDRLDRILSNFPDSVELENLRDSVQRLIIGQEENRIYWRNLWIALAVSGGVLILLLIGAAGLTWWCCVCCKKEEERAEEERKRMQEEGIVATPIIAYDPYYGSYASTVYMCTPGRTVVSKGGKKGQEPSKTSKMSKKDVSKKGSKKESKKSQKSKKSEKSKKSQISESGKSQTKSAKKQESSKVVSGSTEVTATATNQTASAEPKATQGNDSSVLSAPLNL